MKLSAIIMASGLSKRMGFNKLLEQVGPKKLYLYCLDRVEQLGFDQVILVSAYDEILREGRKRGYKTIYNKDKHLGKAESIRLGIEATDQDQALVFLVADQPFLRKETLEALVRTHKSQGGICFPTHGTRRGNPVIFPASARQDLLALRGDEGGMNLLKSGKWPLNPYPVKDELELFDIDDMDDLDRARDLLWKGI